EKTAPARWLRPRYGAGADQVTDLKIAAIAGVVRDHLRESPIHQRERALRQTLRWHAVPAHCRGCEISFQRDVQSTLRAVLRVVEIGQRRRIALRPSQGGGPKWHQRLRGHYPGRNGRGEILAQKRAERLGFPRLNVTRRPVV